MATTMTAMSPKVERVMALYHQQIGESCDSPVYRRYLKAEQQLSNEERIAYWRARHAQAIRLVEAEQCQQAIQAYSEGFLDMRQATALVAALRAIDIKAQIFPYTNLVVADAEAEKNATLFRVVGFGPGHTEYVYRDAVDLISVLRQIGRRMGYAVDATAFTPYGG